MSRRRGSGHLRYGAQRTGGGRETAPDRSAPLGAPRSCPDCGTELVGDCSLPMTLCPIRACPECDWYGIDQGDELVEIE